jgi:hypothetical protein
VTGIDRNLLAGWDEFLALSPRGQFQQASGWARVKALDGWSAVREYMDPAEPGSGGFQLLWKRSRLARIGYVTKGPVLPEETQPAVDAALDKLTSAARRLRLSAVLVQPPDDSRISSDALVKRGFYAEPAQFVARATGIVSLEGGIDRIVAGMSRTARQNWQSARRERVVLTWGTRADLPQFFSLMCGSCRRQHEVPNPSRVQLLEALWDAMPGRISLAFAEHDGHRLAGLAMIAQGRRIVFWKKGWDSEQPRLYANQFLMTECLIRASAMGFAEADMLSMAPDIAAAILAGQPLSEEQSRSRDRFNLRLGARPKFLPPAHLLVVNPALRRAVYPALRWPRLRQALEARVR